MEIVALASDERAGLMWRFRVLASVWERLKGLLGTASDAAPVLLLRCASIHTFGMRYALDVAFIGEDGLVLLVRKGLSPGNVVSCDGACCVAERPASDEPWFVQGERLRMLAIDVCQSAAGALVERTSYEC